MRVTAYSLRIISGRFKGKKLASFKGQHVRPTSDRVREAIFDILSINWEGKEILDLFAGTGALGIEALSRGAHRLVCIENHPQALKILAKNVDALSLAEHCEVVRFRVEDGLKFIRRNGWKFDVSFLDPPYGRGLADSTLCAGAASEAMKGSGIVVAEHHYKERVSERYQQLQLSDQRRYGSTKVSFFISIVP